jgi:hypothetical protein
MGIILLILAAGVAGLLIAIVNEIDLRKRGR